MIQKFHKKSLDLYHSGPPVPVAVAFVCSKFYCMENTYFSMLLWALGYIFFIVYAYNAQTIYLLQYLNFY